MCQSSANMEPEEKSFVECNELNVSETNVDHDGGSPVLPALSDSDVIPQSEKRKRRQWAAWTREEEECFFTALRQVGKNFEKITSRVQSKNKDQVRHYYYRLVRRMNKLLGPGFFVDAKNSKDTTAAMLRWWSVLEKYSCKVSKLHLKPRRFKIFVETLEHQLLKDKKKNVKKQLSQGEKCSFPTSTFPNQNKSSVNDSRPIKIVAVDGQNVEKSGNGKGSSTRRSLNLGVTKSNNKGDSSAKLTKQRRKTGVVSTAAIKRWEKAAMAGVSLVADAAEHVERTSKEERANFLDGLSVLSAQAVGCSMEHNDPGCSGQVQANLLTKLKLQLFPIDDDTRKALEMDNHNPHLELTLSARKKITSVLEHMARKWGSSSVASGELVLFPYNIQRENISAYQRWSRDSIATATEVFALIGSPPIFRMRYGWMVAGELQSAIPEAPVALSINSLVENTIAKETPTELTIAQVEKKDEMGKHVGYSLGGQPTEENSTTASIKANPVSNVEDNCLDSPNLPSVSKRNKSTSGKIKKVDHRLKKTLKLSAGEWADSLTDVSAEDLIPEDNAVTNCVESLETPFQSSHCLDAVSFTCDSFDAAIAAHISSQYRCISKPSLQLSSIWDAEETCDEFTFQKNALARKRDQNEPLASSSLAGNGKATSSSASFDLYQVLPEETVAEDVNEEDQMDESPSEPYEIENPSKDFGNLTDIYWPESLGPLELDVPSCKYYSEDLILSDSLSGLNRFIIANSLDTFQHCPLFGFDDKGLSPAAGAQRGASFAGKIGTGDSAGVRSLQV